MTKYTLEKNIQVIELIGGAAAIDALHLIVGNEKISLNELKKTLKIKNIIEHDDGRKEVTKIAKECDVTRMEVYRVRKMKFTL